MDNVGRVASATRTIRGWPRRPLTNLIQNVMTMEVNSELDYQFENATHETATAFKIFDNNDVNSFFDKLNPCWNPPAPSFNGERMLYDVYECRINCFIRYIQRARGGVIEIDGATNRLSKSVSNVIINLPVHLPVEYLRAELKRETTVNVVAKITEDINRL